MSAFSTLATAPLRLFSGTLSVLFSRRGLFALCLVFCVLIGTRCWLRPSLSADITAFQLPLLGFASTASADAASAFIEGDRPLPLLSPGVVLSVFALAGLLVALLRPQWMPIAAGGFFAVLLACQLSISCNHPEIVLQMSREAQVRTAVVSLLEVAAPSAVEISTFPRVKNPSPLVEPGSLTSVSNYIPHELSTFPMLALAAVLLLSSGSLPRRLCVAACWCVVGGLLFVGVCGPRLVAEWHWRHAVVAEQESRLEDARAAITATLEGCPALVNLPRTSWLAGKIDFLTEQDTIESRYFQARQIARTGDLEASLHQLMKIHNEQKLVSDRERVRTGLWVADMAGRLATREAADDHFEAAAEHWRLAMSVDSSANFRPLCLAALRSRWSGSPPDQVLRPVFDLMDSLADRSLKAALLAMAGDCYYAAGEVAAAREQYQASLEVFSLPKTINYRALRGLLGW